MINFLNSKFLAPWDKNGASTITANKALLNMIATQLLPFNLVDGIGFRKFVETIQPKFKIPGRNHFSQYELPQRFDEMKVSLNNLKDK